MIPEKDRDILRRLAEEHAQIAALPVRPAPDPAPTPTPAEAAPVESKTPETAIAGILNARPKLKPAAPRRPSRHVRLASQPASTPPATDKRASDKAALDAALRAILGNTASSAGGASR